MKTDKRIIDPFDSQDYLQHNRKLWNKLVSIHIKSDFYDVEAFLKGKSSLNTIELDLLGDIRGKSILHLQCHFGQDSISLSRLGARVTGVDLSDEAIGRARELAEKAGTGTTFICSDVYALPSSLDGQFDIVFSSYGTIGWLPDLDRWAAVIARYLKPGGRFVFAEFHPVVWMFDDDLDKVAYSYFNTGPLMETVNNSYADNSAEMNEPAVMWNHGLAEVLSSLMKHGLQVDQFNEYDYSPYNCLRHLVEEEPGKFRIGHLQGRLPLVYALAASKK